jgi:hypothetical protein
MERNTLERFFTAKYLIIPNYQRDYAWTQQNIDDLLNDVAESIETRTGHYIGTFILSRTVTEGTYHVVDGQQRLTTLTMVLNAVIAQLSETAKIINKNAFIHDIDKNRPKLRLADYNQPFFTELLTGKFPTPVSKSQSLLTNAYSYIAAHINALTKSKPESAGQYLESLKQLEVMEFIETDEGKAIRIFQTVNDRGQPLAIIDKAKSLLIYYSNRHLSGRFDGLINESFGEMFQKFAKLKELGERSNGRIRLIGQSTFTEDSVMRYHFLGYRNEYYDYRASTEYVLNSFLKRTLKQRQADTSALEKFIEEYVLDLRAFFGHFLNLIERSSSDAKYYKIFSVLGISTFLYPLAIRLQARGLLDQPYQEGQSLTFADLIEIADVRIYKSRGTDPARDLSLLACEAATESPSVIATQLGVIVRRFMDDSRFDVALNENMYENEAVLHLLIEMGEAWAREQGRSGYSVADLIRFMQTDPTVEHVFGQAPPFAFPSRGFQTEEEYVQLNDRLGNLSVLEKDLNSRCQNKTPEQKLDDISLYKTTRFDTTLALVAEAAASGQQFVASSITERTKRLAEFAKRRWPLWK